MSAAATEAKKAEAEAKKAVAAIDAQGMKRCKVQKMSAAATVTEAEKAVAEAKKAAAAGWF
jgi:hypothetical protein